MSRIFRMLWLLPVAMLLHNRGIAQGYTYNNVAMGGGGFVSGLITSKTQQNLMYARTDVGGAYRWDVSSGSWMSLLDWTSENQTGYQGVESFAIDPQATNKLYMLVGTSYFNNGTTAILRSTDYGNTFSITDVSSQFKAHGNGMGRQNGEKLVVDPNNGDVLFCGSRRNGLFKSSNAGLNWGQVASLGTIVTPNDNGVSFVLIDPASGTAGNASQRIFMGISNTGNNFYISNDGGITFNPVAGAPTALMPQRAVITSDRNVLITYADKEGPWNPGSGQIWKYNPQTAAWTNITPSGTTYPYSGISVDPNNPLRIIASTINIYTLQYGSTYGDRLYLSTDGGTTWRNLVGSGITLNSAGCTWLNGQSIHWAGCIEFNPFNTSQAWVVSGNGVFVCNDLSATPTTWNFGSKGIEETVPLDMVSLTGGPLFSVIGDYDGFKHTDITQYAPIHSPRMGTTNGIAVAALDNNKLLRVGSNLYYTANQGVSWSQASSTGSGGKVALSADGSVWLHCPANSTVTSRSVNNGSSWTPCTGISINGAVPVADPVNPMKFYANNTSSGFMMISTDGGVSFSNAASLAGSGSKLVRTAPGNEGHLWVAMYGGGLKRSVNSGTSFTKLNSVTSCSAVGLGKAAPGATYYTIYIWGNVGGVTGVFRSIDEGINWTRVNDDAHEYGGPGNGQFVTGDINVYGRYYMSTVGRGIAYGEISSVLPVSFADFSVTLNSASQAGLNWNTLSEFNNSQFEIERSLDGASFTKISSVPTKAVHGTSTAPLNYYYADNVAGITGTIYYRLKQVDRDGKGQLSKVVALRVKPVRAHIETYPNPATARNINLEIRLANPENVQVRISSLSGAIIYTGAILKLPAGVSKLDLDQKIHINSGVYMIELLSAQERQSLASVRLVVQ